ncbi:hypothetical protein AMECASPLE_031411 [Ameca splendens]|uniref:Uncharacterized protein n=1 Tax=Ameca splendens TaxID=208324 RepID=A0ABV0XJ81_9TELE
MLSSVLAKSGFVRLDCDCSPEKLAVLELHDLDSKVVFVGFNESLTGSLRHQLLMEVQCSQNYRVLVCCLDGSHYWKKQPQNFHSLVKVLSLNCLVSYFKKQILIHYVCL